MSAALGFSASVSGARVAVKGTFRNAQAEKRIISARAPLRVENRVAVPPIHPHGPQEGTVLPSRCHRLSLPPRRLTDCAAGLVRSDQKGVLFGRPGDQGLAQQGCAAVRDRGCFAEEGSHHAVNERDLVARRSQEETTFRN
ncbi:hypothetical protein BE221DRAFT_78125 [Ostreococcus tauri]|uniref:Uncharacterized protein n=1 Tax=Ostreococcus tauri TaxID=70448 RepID=A0A1Y5IAY8_OSTTA|nr:hypothetical protein BE221DRAFT_78125 [Ostreococcus tauri]